MCDISVVIPVRDEAENIIELIERISLSLENLNKHYEIIFVTDTNRDRTAEVVIERSSVLPFIKCIKLASSYGQHVAVIAGLEHCIGEYVVIMDGDLQDCPEDIPLLYKKITEGYEVVYGIKESKNDSFFRNVSSRAFNGMMNSLSDTRMRGNSSMFRMLTRKALREVLKFREIEPSLTYIFSYINLPSASVAVRSEARHHGKTKYSFLRLVGFALASLLSFSRKPLRMISVLGITMSALSFLYFGVVLLQYFLYQISVLGWATMIVIITFMGGIQLLSLGVIGEYVGRIYLQTKNRPLYIIERQIGIFDD